jgi:hypothetical protein
MKWIGDNDQMKRGNNAQRLITEHHKTSSDFKIGKTTAFEGVQNLQITKNSKDEPYLVYVRYLRK